jgi:hypothetical protein
MKEKRNQSLRLSKRNKLEEEAMKEMKKDIESKKKLLLQIEIQNKELEQSL